MNRLDVTQFEIPAVNSNTAMYMVWCTYFVAVLGASAAVGMGMTEQNPTDRLFAVLAWLPISVLLVDAWALFVVFTRRRATTPLRVPVKTPVILAIVHLASGWLATRSVRADVLYELVWVDDHVGNYEVQWSVASLVIGLALISILLAGFEAKLVRWVLLSEITAAGSQSSLPADKIKDRELGSEHVYEAQVLLNNLGYDVSPITGEMNQATVNSLKRFQTSAELDSDGKLTAKSMIELRNRWRLHEEEAKPVMTVSEHVVRKTGSKIAQFFRGS